MKAFEEAKITIFHISKFYMSNNNLWILNTKITSS